MQKMVFNAFVNPFAQQESSHFYLQNAKFDLRL